MCFVVGFVFTQHTRGLTASIYCHGIACSMCVLSWDCFSLNTLVVWLLWYNYCHEIACSMCVLSRDFFSLHKLAVWLLWYNCHGIAYISLTKLHQTRDLTARTYCHGAECISFTKLVIRLQGCVDMGLYFIHHTCDLTARTYCHGTVFYSPNSWSNY